MKKTAIVLGVIGIALDVCCVIVHRRVIKSIIKGEPMPKAPNWHIWVAPEDRRGAETAAAAEPAAAAPAQA